MRRSAAIILLLVFCSFLSAPLLAASSNPYGNLPACCRRDGKHHCMTAMMPEGNQSSRRVSTPAEKCPFFPHAKLTVNVQKHFLAPSPAGAFYGSLLSHPACHAQAEAHQRVSFDRSRQKRGPPSAVTAS